MRGRSYGEKRDLSVRKRCPTPFAHWNALLFWTCFRNVQKWHIIPFEDKTTRHTLGWMKETFSRNFSNHYFCSTLRFVVHKNIFHSEKSTPNHSNNRKALDSTAFSVDLHNAQKSHGIKIKYFKKKKIHNEDYFQRPVKMLRSNNRNKTNAFYEEKRNFLIPLELQKNQHQQTEKFFQISWEEWDSFKK